jgi:hypothetical protein
VKDILLEADIVSFLAQAKPEGQDYQRRLPTLDDIDYAAIGDPREKWEEIC